MLRQRFDTYATTDVGTDDFIPNRLMKACASPFTQVLPELRETPSKLGAGPDLHVFKSKPAPEQTVVKREFNYVLVPPRPLKLFGVEFEVRRSTALSFCPINLVHAATGMSLLREVQKSDSRMWGVIRALQRESEFGSSIRTGTLENFRQISLESGGPEFKLDDLRQLPDRRAAPWRLWFRARYGINKVERRLLVRLAAGDRIAHLIQETVDEEENVRRRKLVFMPSWAHWYGTGFDLPWQVSLPLDMTLSHLAWLDTQLSTLDSPAWLTDPLIGLARPGYEPIRRWFDGLLELTGCKNLIEFDHYLALRGVVMKGENGFVHGRLKKWASGLEPMRTGRATAILHGCGPEVLKGQELRRFWLARLLTFTTELVLSFAESPPSRERAQQAIYTRLVQWRGATYFP